MINILFCEICSYKCFYADDYDLFAYFDENNKELREYLISSNIIDM